MTVRVILRGDIPAGEAAVFHKHVCPPAFGGDNPDPQPPTVTIARNLLVGMDLPLPNGKAVPMWIIEDPNDAMHGISFPSKTIRVTDGDIVHVDVGSRTGTHTIHWHGIEPTPMNDGVGKHSFEVDGHFIYQFQPRAAGTYFYHCHKNTTLHFEMGLYGLLIVDPKHGPGFISAFNPPEHVIPYDVEAFWVVDEIDSRWHQLGHNDFMQKCDANTPIAPENFSQDGFLNQFRPDIFLITGVARASEGMPITDPRVAITAKVGQTVLIRLLHAGYTVQQYDIGIDVEVVAMDGRALGVPPFQHYSHPFTLPAHTLFRLSTARRVDLILRSTTPGVFPVMVSYLDWITGKPLGTAQTAITVTPEVE